MNTYDDSYYYTDTAASSGTEWIAIVIFLIIIAGLAALVYFLLKKRRILQQERALKRAAFQVTMPKQTNLEEDRRDPKETIGAMEVVFASLSHFYQDGFLQIIGMVSQLFPLKLQRNRGKFIFMLFSPKNMPIKLSAKFTLSTQAPILNPQLTTIFSWRKKGKVRSVQ